MTIQAIYLFNGPEPDAAIGRGLCEAGCQIVQAHTITETLKLLQGGADAGGLPDMPANRPHLLVAEVQVGAIPLLTLLRDMADERLNPTALPSLLYDREGTDIHAAIRALQLGANDYLLATDPDVQRELAARLLAERIIVAQESRAPWEPGRQSDVEKTNLNIRGRSELRPHLPVPPATRLPYFNAQYEWDAAAGVVRAGDSYVRLSRTEGRIFNLLARERGHAVSVDLLIAEALLEPNLDVETGAERLRPHVMRLRRKLSVCSDTANRIVSVRGVGYMLA